MQIELELFLYVFGIGAGILIVTYLILFWREIFSVDLKPKKGGRQADNDSL